MVIIMIIRDEKYILDFLSDEGKDFKGRTYTEMVNCSDEEMEQCHDQIQHMFPLHEESKFADTYPLINKKIIEVAKRKSIIMFNLLIATNRMEEFFGIGEFEDKEKWKLWCKNRNHNLLRITRIIRCLRLFGLDGIAENFYSEVVVVGREMNLEEKTFEFWEKALKEPIWDSLR